MLFSLPLSASFRTTALEDSASCLRTLQQSVSSLTRELECEEAPSPLSSQLRCSALTQQEKLSVLQKECSVNNLLLLLLLPQYDYETPACCWHPLDKPLFAAARFKAALINISYHQWVKRLCVMWEGSLGIMNDELQLAGEHSAAFIDVCVMSGWRPKLIWKKY